MSMFSKIGNSILNSNKKNKKIGEKNISLMKSNSTISLKTNSNFFNKDSRLLNFRRMNNQNTDIIINKPTYINNNKSTNELNTIRSNSNNLKNATTASRFRMKDRNNYKKFKDLGNSLQFISTNVKDYILEADKIINQRLDDNHLDIAGLKTREKKEILLDTREICRHNSVIDAIKKDINKIKLKTINYKKSLIQSELDMKNDLKNFRLFLDSKNEKIKQENYILSKEIDKHDKSLEIYDKEMLRYKKLSEELEKKIKIICLLKNYGAFIYKILGIKFWLDGVPEINQKTKNFEHIADIVIEKYRLLNKKEQANKEENYFDDTFLIIKFKELEQRVLQSINSNGFQIRDLKEKIYKENTLDRMNSTLSQLTFKKNDITIRKNRLMKNIDKSKNIKFDNESFEQFLEYIIELGKETEKCNIDVNIYFPDLIKNDFEKQVKKQDFRYYTVKTLNNLKKKETLINKFNEYIDNIKQSEDRSIFMEIEQDRKNRNKKEKLKQLKLKQEQLHNEKNKRAMQRNTKMVVTGRIVPKKYQFIKHKKTNTNIENKVKDDLELLYYNEDY